MNNTVNTIKPGDVVLAPFPFMEGEGKKLRPALVWETTPVSVRLVYVGTSKMCPSAPSPTEVYLCGAAALAVGLNADSKIDFGKRARIPLCEVKRVLGSTYALNQGHKRVLRRMHDAALAVGLLSE